MSIKKVKRNVQKRGVGPIVEIIILAIVIALVCLIFNLLGASGYKTDLSGLETSLITVENILSKAGIRHILSNSLVNFQTLEPLVMLVMSLIAVSILEASGLLKQIFNPLKKWKSKYVTLLVMGIGIISTIIGDYSYAMLLPISGIIYKYAGKNSSLGVLTMFIAITIGYGTGLTYNYQMYELGKITETSARSITANYSYSLLSNVIILVVSTIVLTVVGTFVLEKLGKKFPRNEEKDNLNISKKASRITLITFFIMTLLFIYAIIPGLPSSGMLLDRTETTYIAMLFGTASPLNQGFMFLMIAILMICGFVYGTVSRNIKNSDDYSKALTKTFEGTGYVFVLMFFISILYEVIDWTHISEVISVNIVDFIGSSNLSGIILVIVAFLAIVLISIFIPSTLAKWKIISPIFVPFLMRSNISPAFTQTIFLAADSVGKLFSPIYIFLIITIGFMYKFEDDVNISIIGTMKKIMPSILVLSLAWIIIIVGWYLLGFPIGINSWISL